MARMMIIGYPPRGDHDAIKEAGHWGGYSALFQIGIHGGPQGQGEYQAAGSIRIDPQYLEGDIAALAKIMAEGILKGVKVQEGTSVLEHHQE